MYTPLGENLAGKRALVTGGTKGADAAIAQRLAQSGATVVVTARTQPDGIDPKLFIAADISTPEGTDVIVGQAIERLDGVDILVNSVGGSEAPGGGFAALSDEEWLQELNLNLLAAVRLDRGLRPRLRHRRRRAHHRRRHRPHRLTTGPLPEEKS